MLRLWCVFLFLRKVPDLLGVGVMSIVLTLLAPICCLERGRFAREICSSSDRISLMSRGRPRKPESVLSQKWPV